MTNSQLLGRYRNLLIKLAREARQAQKDAVSIRLNILKELQHIPH